jgi:hypothetical protein
MLFFSVSQQSREFFYNVLAAGVKQLRSEASTLGNGTERAIKSDPTPRIRCQARMDRYTQVKKLTMIHHRDSKRPKITGRNPEQNSKITFFQAEKFSD